MKLKIIKYVIAYALIYNGLATADAWKCPNNPGNSFASRQAASYACGGKEYLIISADSGIQNLSSMNISPTGGMYGSQSQNIGPTRGIYNNQTQNIGWSKGVYVNRTQAQDQKYEPTAQTNIRPYSANFPYAGISNYGDFSSGAGLGDW